jgi:ABC-2 type transport system ATP-binding protein
MPPIPAPAIPRGEPIIEISGLVKRYGGAAAVDGIDLTVRAGEIFGILGPNGAGKTTTLEMIEGLRTPDAGTIRVAGLDAVADSATVRTLIGVQLQTTSLFDYLSVAELVRLYCALYGADDSPANVERLITLVGLEEKSRARVDELSGGQRQRLSITLALVNQPIVAFLDEPTTGLDPAARRALWQVVRNVRDAGATVVLTTHYMEEAETLCDRLAVMDRGKIIALDTPRGLIRGLGMEATIHAQTTNGALDDSEITALPGVRSSTIVAGDNTTRDIALRTADVQQTLVALLALADQRGADLVDLRSTQANLEDVFLSLTGRAYEHALPATAANEHGRRRRRRGAA